jgi:hypothetical protein
MTEPQTFRDLSTLARDRCRAANESVIQLLDSEQEAAAVLLYVAADMVCGAASFMGEDKPKALQGAVNMLIENLRNTKPPTLRTEMRS